MLHVNIRLLDLNLHLVCMHFLRADYVKCFPVLFFKPSNPFCLTFKHRISKKKSKLQQITRLLLLIILQKFQFVARQGWGTWQYPVLLL